MEKKQTSLPILLAGIGFLICLTYINPAKAQKLKSFKGHCGLYYETMDGLLKQKQKELDFYSFQPGQTVGSIGAQCCHWEAAFAAAADSLVFYLEDIDTTHFKRSQTDFAWHYYDSIRGKPMTSRYNMVIGDERSTSLPENSFDKILIINSFHEFTYQKEMLEDIKKKLKPAGILYIDEAMPRRPGQLHGVCNKPMPTDDETVALFAKNGFDYVDGMEMNFRKNKPQRKIFAFLIKK